MTRRRLPRRRTWNLMHMLAMASTTSALSLANFQIITSNRIPSSCIRAYSTEIEDCSRTDFTNGNQCSSGCVQGLQDTATRVVAACGELNVDSRSLLGLTLSGSLIDTLCPGFEATTVTLTVPPTTTQAGFTTPIPVLVTTSSATSTSDTSTTLRTTTSVAQQTPSPPVTSETTESPTESPTTAETSVQTTAQPVESPSVTQSATTPATTPDEATNQGLDPGSGGGSPFDSVPALGLGATIRPIGWHTPFLLAVLLIAEI